MQMMTIRTGLATRIGLNGPLIQAPMAGGATTPELVAAVCNAGALGSLGGAYLGPTELQNSIRMIKALTDRPFAVNLFAPCPEPALSDEQIEAAIAATQSYRDELGIPAPVVQPPFSQKFEDQFAVVRTEKPAVFSFTFGLPGPSVLEECRKCRILTFGTATTLDEAVALQEAGVDAVVAQGAEAGAQRGTFQLKRKTFLSDSRRWFRLWRANFVFQSSPQAGSWTDEGLQPRSLLALKRPNWAQRSLRATSRASAALIGMRCSIRTAGAPVPHGLLQDAGRGAWTIDSSPRWI